MSCFGSMRGFSQHDNMLQRAPIPLNIMSEEEFSARKSALTEYTGSPIGNDIGAGTAFKIGPCSCKRYKSETYNGNKLHIWWLADVQRGMRVN